MKKKTKKLNSKPSIYSMGHGKVSKAVCPFFTGVVLYLAQVKKPGKVGDDVSSKDEVPNSATWILFDDPKHARVMAKELIQAATGAEKVRRELKAGAKKCRKQFTP